MQKNTHIESIPIHLKKQIFCSLSSRNIHSKTHIRWTSDNTCMMHNSSWITLAISWIKLSTSLERSWEWDNSLYSILLTRIYIRLIKYSRSCDKYVATRKNSFIRHHRPPQLQEYSSRYLLQVLIQNSMSARTEYLTVQIPLSALCDSPPSLILVLLQDPDLLQSLHNLPVHGAWRIYMVTRLRASILLAPVSFP